MNEEYLEREADMPDGWVSNLIFQLDGRGHMVEMIIPDDEEVTEDVADN